VQLKALHEQAAAEAAAAAAVAEYEQVGHRNESDMEDFGPQQISDLRKILLGWTAAVGTLADTEARQWLQAAQYLGAEPAHVDAIAAL
jgi:hypothetical protein